MSINNKVAWLESQFLFPQHFQQQDRYFESRIEARSQPIRPYVWGFTRLQIDNNNLVKGDLGIVTAQGIMPDGTPLDLPHHDTLPAPLQVPRQAKNLLIYLVLPEYQPGACLLETKNAQSNNQTRYRLQEMDVYDYCGGNTAVERVETAALQCRLASESEELGGFTRLPIARVQEVTQEGAILLDKRFIPPSIRIRSNPELNHYLQDTLGRLQERGDALAQRFIASRQVGGSAAIADFMLLQLVNRFEPRLRHLDSDESVHPETLYQELLGLAGELATFTTMGKRPLPTPAYCHEDLYTCFQPLMDNLGRHLSAVLERTAIPLTLEQRQYGIRVARVTDRSLLHQGRFVLAVKADASTDDVRDRVPTHMKVGTVETIRDLVNNQLPGIELTVLPIAPREIPYHAGSVYFELGRNSDYWQKLKQSGGLALHVTGDFPGLDINLWAIRE
ncbi:MAG: type VI secretion system baseplate subunit TssK [Gammaproteobacteria bacterium]|nr:type VI secretion system baseplate subunit TssK [Gammaproteobacteria bacterium]